MAQSFYLYDVITFCGRFQPFHNGHFAVIKKALQISEFVNIVVGSSGCARSLRNPFTADERSEMIRGSFSDHERERLQFSHVSDHPYNEAAWLREVKESLQSYEGCTLRKKYGLIGHAKDHSSYYLKLFPEWSSVDCAGIQDSGILLNATDIRNRYFNIGLVSDVSSETMEFLRRFRLTGNYRRLKAEFDHIRSYREKWKNSPYPPIFVTVDAVCVQAGHILLVTRKSAPGEGLLALPGGFIGEYEDTFEATLRELQEETSIDVPEAVLRNKVKARRLFDYPYRSDRGRTITYATLFDLNDELTRRANKRVGGVPHEPLGFTKVRGGDDASDAKWYDLALLNPELLFEDHYHIIRAMLGLG